MLNISPKYYCKIKYYQAFFNYEIPQHINGSFAFHSLPIKVYFFAFSIAPSISYSSTLTLLLHFSKAKISDVFAIVFLCCHPTSTYFTHYRLIVLGLSEIRNTFGVQQISFSHGILNLNAEISLVSQIKG